LYSATDDMDATTCWWRGSNLWPLPC